jgi:hypothetical protein
LTRAAAAVRSARKIAAKSGKSARNHSMFATGRSTAVITATMSFPAAIAKTGAS